MEGLNEVQLSSAPRVILLLCDWRLTILLFFMADHRCFTIYEVPMHVVLEKGAISYDDLFMHLGYRFSFGADYVDLEFGLATTSLPMKSSKSGHIF